MTKATTIYSVDADAFRASMSRQLWIKYEESNPSVAFTRSSSNECWVVVYTTLELSRHAVSLCCVVHYGVIALDLAAFHLICEVA
ncbi:hypothetical protein ElyMa_004169800 [Elysia marginata]|uniref:Uncharacterized protein n=1 Tax=Elysia marginata TaxID=1093978 RepID=A0AAV4GIF3_9GAST|nr:hypothetical protein ElyMa_004169800 [Elysia marginata]